MTTITRLTRAEVRKLATTLSFPIALVVSVGLAVLSVAADAFVAGKNGVPALGTVAGADKMLKIAPVCCVAMLVVGIMASGGEFRHKTIIPAVLITPRRAGLVIAKAIAITVAGAVLSGVTFGVDLATAVIELHVHHLHQLPPDTWRLYAGSVFSGVLFGLIGVALGYITRSTVVAIVGAVGWVVFVELAILDTVAPHLAKWLVAGAAVALTDPTVTSSTALAPATAVAVLAGYAIALLAIASGIVSRRDIA
jgi:hypothetical protein